MAGRHGFRRSKAAESHGIDGGFSTATQRKVGFVVADQAHGIANGLHTSGTGGNRRTDWAFELMLDRYLTGGQVDQERRNSKRRQALRTAVIVGSHRVGNRRETTNT